MIWLSSSTLVRLRDQLQQRGRRPSIVAADPSMSPENIELQNIVGEYGPLCEAMYLMMSADGAVGEEEREVLKGALRNLSGDTIRTAHMDKMLEDAGKAVADQGRDARMQAIVADLHEDKPRAEVAFVLAAAIAFADNAIADEENETLNTFAEGLGIDEARANQLLDEVEADMGKEQPPSG
ncbi:MAG: TerB family tellurite resistance protein [Labilithrix sp.]|nr:TerB family tellurite resistance protein [Labilithrix sp.]MCW5816488.1 TerB family tellurite resistance protein [Labilithrix sp.]